MLKWEKCRSSLIHKDCHWVHDWENPAPKTAYMTVILYFHHLKKTKKLCMSLQNKMFLSPKISSGKRKTNYNSCLASTLATLPGVAFAGFCCGTSMQPSSCVRFWYWISCKFISFMWLASPPGSYPWLWQIVLEGTILTSQRKTIHSRYVQVLYEKGSLCKMTGALLLASHQHICTYKMSKQNSNQRCFPAFESG